MSRLIVSLLGSLCGLSAFAAEPQVKCDAPLSQHEVPASGVARAPVIGWTSSNAVGESIDDATVRQMADALVESGLREYGYLYVNIGDSWQGVRDAAGTLHSNAKFPDMKALADYLHDRYLELGIYSPSSPSTCAKRLGNHGHKEKGQDARTFAQWGVKLIQKDIPAGPNGLNDPGPLEVGAENVSLDEYRMQVTRASMLAAPLWLANDLRRMTPLITSLLTNKEVIGIDQDPAGKQARRLWQRGTVEVWSRPLADESLAVAMFNRGEAAAPVQVGWSELGLTKASSIRDLWHHADLEVEAQGLRILLLKHGVTLLRIRPQEKPNSALVPVQQQFWEARHAQKVALVRQHRYDLLLLGDSITHNFDELEYQGVWRQFFAPRNALDLGYGGGRIENILWNLTHGELENQSPKVVTLLIGTNNSDNANYPVANSAEQIAEGTAAIVKLLRDKLPDAKILLLRIFPRTNVYRDADGSERGSAQWRWSTNLRAGELTASLADNQHVFYLDVNSIFLRPDGSIDPQLMPDLLHPSPEGALLWARAMEPTLSKLFGDAPRT